MSIVNEIQRLQTAKANIKASIENKGVTVGDGLIDTYSKKIDEIQNGKDPYYIFSYAENVQLVDLDIFNTTELVINSDVFKSLYHFAYHANNTKVTSIIFNTPTLGELSYAFTNQSIIQSITFRNGVRVMSSSAGAFNGCNNLTVINGEMNLSYTISSGYNNMFKGCSALTTFFLRPRCMSVSFSLGDSPNLDDATINNLVEGLSDLTGKTPQVLTVHSTVYAKMVNVGLDVTISAKNWTLESAN